MIGWILHHSRRARQLMRWARQYGYADVVTNIVFIILITVLCVVILAVAFG
jgi:hypothetical protein